jgi:MMP 1-O-methyltransferase
LRSTTGLHDYIRLADTIPGWITGTAARALAEASHDLPPGAVIVEIGSFFGRSAILLAGARQLRGSGRLHCVDPFDCSGDDFSVSHYRRILDEQGGGALIDHFMRNVRDAGLEQWIETHRGAAPTVAAHWTTLIDMLVLDGDQSPKGAREAYDAWLPFLRLHGTLALCNSGNHPHEPSHSGHRLLAEGEVVGPKFTNVKQIGALCLAQTASLA